MPAIVLYLILVIYLVFEFFFKKKKAKFYNARNDKDQIEMESKTDICPRLSYGQFQTCLKNVDSFVFFGETCACVHFITSRIYAIVPRINVFIFLFVFVFGVNLILNSFHCIIAICMHKFMNFIMFNM